MSTNDRVLGGLESSIQAIHDSQVRLEATMVALRAEVRDALEAHEKRIRENENWRSRANGLAVGAGAVVTFLGGVLFHLLSLLG